jgi:hypothetical protein
MKITYFDLLDTLDRDFDDDLIDTIFLGYPAPIPADHEDHATDCFNFWKERI